MPRAASSLPGTLESRSSSGTRPTSARQMCASRRRPWGSGREIWMGLPLPSGRLAQQRQRQPVRVEDRIGLLLPGVAGQRLLEVAGLVQQAHADQRHAEVRRRLQVVSGQDAQAARVLRQDLGDAELGREVGNARPGRRRPGSGTSGAAPGTGRGRRAARWTPLHHVLVRGQPLQLLAADQAEEGHRILAALGPDLGVESLEELPGGPVPGPAQVGGQPWPAAGWTPGERFGR